MQRGILWGALALFGVLSAWVVARVGLLALFLDNLNHPAGQQVFADLVIALCLVMAWMWTDARKTGRKAWPWLVATLLLGSFGPLVYLITRKEAP